MKISLIMLAYNSERYIRQAINSVLGQTYPHWELIVQDDGSSDKTMEIVQGYTDTRISLERNPENLGIVKNRAKAFGRCTGDLVGHLDADDELEPGALAQMFSAAKRNPHVKLFYSDLQQIDAYGRHELYSEALHFDRSKLWQHGWRHLTLYRRDVMDTIEGYNERLRYPCEDGDLFLQIAEQHMCMRVPRVMYRYRRHESNGSNKRPDCGDCDQRAECNYVQIWAKSAGYDPITFAPEGELPKSNE